MYFCFMVINNIFSNNLVEANKYYELIKSLMQTTSSKRKVLPHYYYVPKNLIELEQIKINSQTRQPSPEIEKDSSHLWTQSIWMICQFLVDKILLINDLDPIRRNLLASERPRQSKRYSMFHVRLKMFY